LLRVQAQEAAQEAEWEAVVQAPAVRATRGLVVLVWVADKVPVEEAVAQGVA
jgi:hypothetical protein